MQRITELQDGQSRTLDIIELMQQSNKRQFWNMVSLAVGEGVLAVFAILMMAGVL